LTALRDAAALFVEAGKALGRLEQNRLLIEQLTRMAGQAKSLEDPVAAELLEGAAHQYAAELGRFEKLAATAQAHALAVMAELERPGTVLARRLVAVALAARAAWRGSR
jgi:hypothetical protein